jgi:hypothetical protein
VPEVQVRVLYNKVSFLNYGEIDLVLVYKQEEGVDQVLMDLEAEAVWVVQV